VPLSEKNSQAALGGGSRVAERLLSSIRDLRPGDSVLLVAGCPEEGASELTRFVTTGLLAGDLCYLVLSSEVGDSLRSLLAARGVDLDAVLARGQVVWVHPYEFFGRSSGGSAERRRRVLDQLCREARSRGYGGVRLALDGMWLATRTRRCLSGELLSWVSVRHEGVALVFTCDRRCLDRLDAFALLSSPALLSIGGWTVANPAWRGSTPATTPLLASPISWFKPNRSAAQTVYEYTRRMVVGAGRLAHKARCLEGMQEVVARGLTHGRGSLRQRLEPVLDWLRGTLVAEAVSLYWRRPGGGTVALLGKAGSLGAPAQLPLSSIEWRLVRGAHRVAACRDARAAFGSLPATHPEVRSLLVAAVGAIPGRPTGALVVAHRVAEWFDEQDAELLGPISSALGMVLASHEQHAALERENRFRAAVVQVSSASATLQREARLFDLICWEAREAWRADTALLWLTSETNPGRLVCRMVSGAWPADLPSPDVDRESPAVMAVAFRERRSVRSSDGRTLAHPLMVGAQAMGVLSLHYGQGLAEGYLTDIEGQAAFASLAASAIWSVRLLDASLREEKVRALGTVAAGILHDVRNCLTPIVGTAEILLSATADERQRRGLELILAGARDAAATLDRIRRFAGLEPADGTQRVDLAEVCRQALELTRSRWLEAYQARARRLEVATAFGKASPVEGSESELRQAVVNLILNALEAMPDGGRLTVSVGETESGPFISVSDTGVGMDAETKRHIFEPFFTTKEASGQGLGLMNLQMTVARHRGRVEVESTTGGGTTFTLRFPPASGGSSPHPGREPGDPEQAAGPPGKGQACVLLVDDNEAVRRTLRAMLEADGHSVTEATSGEEALALLQQGRYDCVLADFALRGVSGLAVAEAAASAPGRPACIIVTGWGGDFDPALLKARNVIRVLFKPVGMSELHEAVRETVRRDAAGAS